MVGTWLLLVAAGLFALMAYGTRPGARGDVPPQWPSDASMSRDTSRATMLVFVHPRCPCSAATVDELGWILTRSADHIDAHVLFVQPAGSSSEWLHTATWNSAGAIPDVSVRSDPQGLLARTFGADTSGHVILYDREGRLRFEGGITRSRGHRGSNPGRASVLAIANPAALPVSKAGAESSVASTAVFGCPLFASNTTVNLDASGEP